MVEKDMYNVLFIERLDRIVIKKCLKNFKFF